jgi:hypothetical protein
MIVFSAQFAEGAGARNVHPLSLYLPHRLKIELDLKKFIWALVYSWTHWLRPRKSPPLSLLGSYTRELWSAKIDDIYLFVTP